MTWEARVARVMAWVALAAGLGLGIACFLLAPEKVTTVERIVGHATITYEGVELVVRESFILAGFASLVLGAALWALLLVTARMADPRTD